MCIGSFVDTDVITIDMSNIYLLNMFLLSTKIKLKIKRIGVLEQDLVSPLCGTTHRRGTPLDVREESKDTKANLHQLLVAMFASIGCWFGLIWFGLWCLTSLSTIFQLYRGGKFYTLTYGPGIQSNIMYSLTNPFSV